MNWPLLQNSLLVSALATALAMLLGLATALGVACLERRWRVIVLVFAAIALAMPPFIVTGCWLDLLGLTGKWRSWLPLNIYSLGGTVWLLALMTWPITLLFTWGAWQQLEVAQLECDPALRGGALLRWLLLPLARSSLGLAAVLTFVLTLNNFSIPAILQTKVFPAEVWVSFNTSFDNMNALRLSWPLVLVPLLWLVSLRHRKICWPAWSVNFPARTLKRQLGGAWFAGSIVITLLAIWLSCVLPIWTLMTAARTWDELPGAFAAGHPAVWNSFLLAAVTATLTVGLSLPLRRFRFGLVFWLPFLVPGVLLGIALIYLLNRPPFLALYQSFGIMILALTVRYFALALKGTQLAWQRTDENLSDAARLAGASRWQLFSRVEWPQIAPVLAATWYITYLLGLWDVESVVLIMPPGGETLASRVFHLLHYGHNAQVNALCAMLLALAVLPLAVWQLRRFLPKRKAGIMLGCALMGTIFFAGCDSANPSGKMEVDSRIFSHVEVIGSRGAGLGQFNKPRSVALDARDNLYVVDMTGRVQKFSPNGTFLLSWQMPQTDIGKPKGMCTDEKGNVVVVEPHYSRVNYFDASGKLLAQWGAHGTNAGQLAFPRSAAVDAQGNIYVSEYGLVERVQKFSAQGQKFIMTIGRPGEGPGELNRAEGVGLDAAGNLYVADSCNHRVEVFSAEGKFLRSYGHAGSGPGEMSYPYDVRVDKEGRQYVCEFGNSRIQIFDANGSLIEILGGPGFAPGKLNNPWSMALDSAGNLYVADAANHRVQKFIRRPGKVAALKGPQ